jgi:uncharacterized protein YecE (DUF72 family)
MVRTHVGVSGFSYPRWRGRFYPENTKAEDFLAYYSQHLDTVEINSSFYASPRASAVQSWFEKTGSRFRFSLKAPGQVTHVLKLGKGAAQSAEKFYLSLDALGGKRGPILFQLPPYFKQDNGVLERFLSETVGVKNRVFEFRHPAWFQESTYALLEKNEASLCIAETEDLKPTFRSTGEPAYFRLRLNKYTERSIDDWAKKIEEVSGGSRESFAYLRHDGEGENALLALRLAKHLAS